MKTVAFAIRNTKEMLRDKLNLIFGIGFPVILLLLFNVIQRSIGDEEGATDLFEINNITPGIAVFGLSFISLFSGMLISKDRASSFMLRMFTSPMTSGNFIVGYIIPLFPMSLLQVSISYITALCLGLTPSVNILLAIVTTIPSMLLFIAIGLISGSLFNEKAVGGLCGALLTNVSAWLSGAWIPLDLIGGGFKAVADVLPFYHAVEAGKMALDGNIDALLPHLYWVTGYAIAVNVIAIIIFRFKMNGEKV